MTKSHTKGPGRKKFSSGIIPIRQIDSKWQFLVLRCFNYWDFPKGEVENDEDPWEAAKRELLEETGISRLKNARTNTFIETPPYAGGKIARYYLAEIDRHEKVVLRPNPLTGILEHHEFRWVDHKEAMELFVPRLRTVIDWAVTHLDED